MVLVMLMATSKHDKSSPANFFRRHRKEHGNYVESYPSKSRRQQIFTFKDKSNSKIFVNCVESSMRAETSVFRISQKWADLFSLTTNRSIQFSSYE